MNDTQSLANRPQQRQLPARSLTLILPPQDDPLPASTRIYRRSLPPTSLAILAAAVKAAKPSVRIRILDGGELALDQIVDQLDGDIVGISTWSVSHRNAIKIARAARAKLPRSMIVMGGPNATHLARQILLNHPEVDAAVVGDGEKAIVDLVAGMELSAAANVAYRTPDGRICLPEARLTNLANLAIFDLEDITPGFDSERVPIPVSFVRGCIKAAKSDTCSYCSIGNRGVRVMPPIQVWQQVSLLKERYGASYFFETGDDFIVGRYPEALLATRPPELRDITWRIYAYPVSLSDMRVAVLERLNVRSVFMGIETITAAALRGAGRDTYSGSELEAVLRCCRASGIRLIAAFIFGLPGEDRKSTLANRAFIKNLVQDFNDVFDVISVSLLTPVAGSAIFRQAVSHPSIVQRYLEATGRNLEMDDIIDYDVLTRLYHDVVIGIDHQWLIEQVRACSGYIQSAGLVSATYMGVERPRSTILLPERGV